MDKKFFLILILLLFVNITLPEKGVAEQSVSYQVSASKFDSRAEILRDYLAEKNSPLQYQAQDFVDAADKYNLDWRLVASIAGVESTFGRFIPGGFNAWGWGVYGDQALGFSSWRDGIFTVSEGLRKGYFDKGLTDPYLINRAYAASPVWGYKVNYFLTDLEKFQRDNAVDVKTVEVHRDSESGSSAKLASNHLSI